MEEQTRFRQFKGTIKYVVAGLLVALPIYCLLLVLHVAEFFQASLFPSQLLGGFLALLMSAAFLLVPVSKKASRHKLPFYDGILALLGFIGGGYIFFFFPRISERGYQATIPELILGIITILLILEAVRRLAGWLLVILCGFFIVHALFGNYFPGMLLNRGYSVTRFTEFLYFYNDGILGVALSVAAAIITIYVLFGSLLQATGGGKIFTDIALSVAGRYRGGPAKVAVMASGLFGMISGSATSNVATTGTMTIPMMKSLGYKAHFAGAVEAVSATGGQIMPPVMGSVAFLIAEYLSISYGEVVIAAAIPAVLYYFAIFVQVDLEAAKMGLRGMPKEQIPSGRAALKLSWLVLVPLIVLLVSLIVFHINASMSGLYGSASLFLLSLIRKESRLNARKLLACFENTGRGMMDVGVICAMAGIIIGSVVLTGLGLKLSYELVTIAGSSLFLLLLITAIASTILGMGLPVMTCYILLVVLVAPAVQRMGVAPLTAHLFVFYYGVMSFITPPVAPAAYVAAGIARANFMSVGYKAMQLGIVAYIIPFFFVYDPSLLMMGSFTQIALAVVSSVIGVFFLCIGIEAYFLHPIGWLSRVLFFIGGAGLMIPVWQLHLLAILPILKQWKSFLLIARGLLGARTLQKK